MLIVFLDTVSWLLYANLLFVYLVTILLSCIVVTIFIVFLSCHCNTIISLGLFVLLVVFPVFCSYYVFFISKTFFVSSSYPAGLKPFGSHIPEQCNTGRVILHVHMVAHFLVGGPLQSGESLNCHFLEVSDLSLNHYR